MVRMISVALISSALLGVQASKKEASPLQFNTLLQTDKAWDGKAYESYPAGRPQLSVLQITIPPNTTMDWHRHPIPNAAYVVNGNLKVETQDGKTAHYAKGQVVAETVGVWHRGVTTDQAADLLVFYAGTPGVPLSEPQAKPAAK